MNDPTSRRPEANSFNIATRGATRRTFMVSLLTLAIAAPGCSSLSSGTSKKDSKWSLFKKKSYQEPKSLVAIWTEDKLVMAGKPVTRGFGGRIYFYNDRSQAVPVDGELVVYGFDDTSRHMASLVKQEADRKFRFTPEQFTEHFSQGELGASYSIWLPWDTDGEPQKEITLFPTFITKSGQLIRGESAKVTLTGPKQLDANGMPQQMQVNAVQRKRPPMLGSEQPTNQVQTASALIPTNEAGSIASFGTTQDQPVSTLADPFAGQRKRSTTIQIPQKSAFNRN